MTDYMTIVDSDDPEPDNPRIKLTRRARDEVIPKLRLYGLELPAECREKDFRRAQAQMRLWQMLDAAEHAAAGETHNEPRGDRGSNQKESMR